MHQFQRDNLLILAQHLDSLPTRYSRFDMRAFHFLPGMTRGSPIVHMTIGPLEVPGEGEGCGTAGCCLGHGPWAGIMPDEGDYSWAVYSFTKFGVKNGGIEDAWLFGALWTEVDNTHQGAAARIRYFLDDGVPERFGTPNAEQVELYQHYVRVEE